jgi:hypothetical protein
LLSHQRDQRFVTRLARLCSQDLLFGLRLLPTLFSAYSPLSLYLIPRFSPTSFPTFSPPFFPPCSPLFPARFPRYPVRYPLESVLFHFYSYFYGDFYSHFYSYFYSYFYAYCCTCSRFYATRMPLLCHFYVTSMTSMTYALLRLIASFWF